MTDAHVWPVQHCNASAKARVQPQLVHSLSWVLVIRSVGEAGIEAKLAAGQMGQERHFGFTGHCPGEKSFARPQRAGQSTPLGIRPPSFWNLSGVLKKSTTS